MVHRFMTDCMWYVREAGIPWTTVSRKTGISYGRLRNLRTGTVELTLTEFVALGKYCELDLGSYLVESYNESEKTA